MHVFSIPRGVAAVVLAAFVGGAGAQAPAAPAAGAGKTLSLGGGTNTGKLLTRDELRACMAQRDTLATRSTAIERQRAELDAERDSLLRGREALKAENVTVDQKKAALDAYSLKVKAFSAKLEDWRTRVAAFNANPGTGMASERQSKDLRTEQAELQKEEQALEPDRLALTASADEAVRAFNARASAAEAQSAQWNQRNNAHNDAAQALSDERQLWVSSCGNRRYREDDETAIKRGQ